MTFQIHTIESAPQASREALEGAKKALGAVPNLYGVLAESPELYTAYRSLNGWFEQTSFSKEERTVVWQSINVEHGCHYCVPAHTAIAHMQKVDPAITNALRDQTPLPDAKLEVLRDVTLELVRKRGRLSAQSIEAFKTAGFAERQLLEIILGLAQKTISNYVNHLADTPVDAMFKDFTWEAKEQQTARV